MDMSGCACGSDPPLPPCHAGSHVMASMNDLVNVAAVSETMRQMAREMAKAGLIEETIEDMFEDLEEDDVEVFHPIVICMPALKLGAVVLYDLHSS